MRKVRIHECIAGRSRHPEPRRRVLDQYKEKKLKDPTIREKFNTYRFSDHKERVIDLLRRVCTVSVATMEIVDGMAHRELGELLA